MKMDFSYLQTLRECAVQCYSDFAWYAPDTFIKHYEELQEAINNIDKDGLHEFFISLNVNNPGEYYFGIPNETKIRLGQLQGFITSNRASISKIIPYIEDIDDFCTDFIPFLDKELQMLKEKTDIDPTDEDNYALGFLNRYSAERWISKFINRDEIPIKTRARRLRLALATDGIDKENQAKLQEALSQIEEQINETARIEQATNELRAKLAGAGLGKDIIDGFLLNYPQMLPRQFKKWYKDILKNNDVTLKDFWSICIRIAHSDKDGKPSTGWGYKNIAAY